MFWTQRAGRRAERPVHCRKKHRQTSHYWRSSSYINCRCCNHAGPCGSWQETDVGVFQAERRRLRFHPRRYSPATKSFVFQTVFLKCTQILPRSVNYYFSPTNSPFFLLLLWILKRNKKEWNLSRILHPSRKMNCVRKKKSPVLWSKLSEWKKKSLLLLHKSDLTPHCKPPRKTEA